MSRERRFSPWLATLLVGTLSLALHLWAVQKLPIDYDEDNYLAAAQRYAAYLKAGNLQGIIDYNYNYEHPPLTKLVYGLVIMGLPEVKLLAERHTNVTALSSLPEPHCTRARLTSAIFGTIECAALAFISPLAGLFLSIHTWQLKYTSQIMLEPLPALTSLLAVLAYVRARRLQKQKGEGTRWMWISAFLMGITAAAKYTYLVAGVAVLIDWLWDTYPGKSLNVRRAWIRWLVPVLAWGALAGAVFFVFNPHLWNDPLGRLMQSLSYHADYAKSDHIKVAAFPPWQPIVWLMMSVPWYSGVFVFSWDALISLLAVAGLGQAWQKGRVYILWLGITLVGLLLWPAKWPQYILNLLAPLCFSAGEGLDMLVALVRRLLKLDPKPIGGGTTECQKGRPR